jgi:hypothetical protein
MIHPLFRLLTSQPQLLAEHASAYGALALSETAELGLAIKRQLAWWLAAAVLASLGLGLAGVAVLLFAAVPPAQMPWPWLLITLPASLLLAAALCAWTARGAALGPAWQLTRAQWALDAQLARAANP